LEEIKDALAELGLEGMTVLEAKGFGRQHGHGEIYRGSEYTYDFVPKIWIVLIVADKMVERVVKAIIEHANTGKIGAGKIFVSPIEEAVQIRTGAKNDEAI